MMMACVPIYHSQVVVTQFEAFSAVRAGISMTRKPETFNRLSVSFLVLGIPTALFSVSLYLQQTRVQDFWANADAKGAGFSYHSTPKFLDLVLKTREQNLGYAIRHAFTCKCVLAGQIHTRAYARPAFQLPLIVCVTAGC